MCQSGVKGNFYAPFVGEGKQATAFSYPTERAWGETPWATHPLMVFSCVNGNKPTNVRYSTTPIGERLTDNYVSGLLSGITKSVMQITGA